MIVGNTAPDFTAEAYNKGEKKKISLQDYRGKWVVLLFYSGDFTFVWPTELAGIAVRYNEFQNLNAEVLAINVDSIYSHKAWDQTELSQMVEGGIPFPILSDITHGIGKAYQVYDEKTGKTIRATFIIDPEGLVHSMEALATAAGRNPEEILRLLKAYQHYSATGEVLPCGWRQGDKAINPTFAVAGGIWREWRPQYIENH